MESSDGEREIRIDEIVERKGVTLAVHFQIQLSVTDSEDLPFRPSDSIVGPTTRWRSDALGQPSLGLFRFLKDDVSKRGPRQFVHNEQALIMWIIVEAAEEWRPVTEVFTRAEQAFGFGLKLPIAEELIARLGAHRAAGCLI